jgi:hypothetical protein
MAVGDADAAPGSFGDRRRPGERLQRSGISESSSIVADLGEQTGAGEISESDQQGDDLVIGVFVEGCGGRFAQPVHACALGV